MRSKLAPLLVGLLALPCWGLIAYSRFVHPQGDYVFDYPADWTQSVGLQTVHVRPSGAQATQAKASVEHYLEHVRVAAADPPTAADYVQSRLRSAEELKKRLESRKTVKVSGCDAERLEFVETKVPKGFSGPLREIYIVISLTHSKLWGTQRDFSREYYVLSLRGIGEAYARALPEFEHIVATFQLRPEDTHCVAIDR